MLTLMDEDKWGLVAQEIKRLLGPFHWSDDDVDEGLRQIRMAYLKGFHGLRDGKVRDNVGINGIVINRLLRSYGEDRATAVQLITVLFKAMEKI